MSRPAFAALALAAAALSSIIGLELRTRPSDDGAVIPNLTRPAAPPPRSPAARPADQAASWAAVAVARPLFSPSRRPDPAAPAAAAAPLAGLPRVAGILISPTSRSVIFASGADGKPVIVREGGKLGAYEVTAIAAGRVTVRGPDGERVLGPSFDASAAKPAAAAADPAGLAGLLGLPQANGRTADPGASIPGLGR